MKFTTVVRKLCIIYREAELAAKVGTSQSTIHKLKSGETKQPAYDLGKRLVDLATFHGMIKGD